MQNTLNAAVTEAMNKGFVQLSPATISIGDRGVGDFSLTESPSIIESNNEKYLILKMNGVFHS